MAIEWRNWPKFVPFKLDEYYRMRDLLNEFDRRNPHLAFRGSGRLMRKRRHSSSSSKSAGEEEENDRKEERKRNGRGGGSTGAEELEEVDSIGEFLNIFFLFWR